MYRLIAVDLDGTLVDDNGLIPESNIIYIKKAIEKNVKVAICSGRSYLSLKRFEEELGLRGEGNYGICFNGGIVYEADTRKILQEVRMENEVAQFVIEQLRYFGVDIVVYVGEELITENPTKRILDYQERSRIPITVVDSLKDIKENVSKVLLRGDYESLVKVEAFIKPLIRGKCNVVFSERTLLEFNDINVDKGTAVRFLAEYLGIKIEDVIAVGNSYNDVEMIREAGLGIAVANAEEDVKKFAGYVTETTNNEGALKEVIEKFILMS